MRWFVVAVALLAISGSNVFCVDRASAQDVPKRTAVKTAAATKTPAREACVVKRGRGLAPTEAGARLQAWEVVAQATGNWPFAKDVLRNDQYKCEQAGSQWRCTSRIDVCKPKA